MNIDANHISMSSIEPANVIKAAKVVNKLSTPAKDQPINSDSGEEHNSLEKDITVDVPAFGISKSPKQSEPEKQSTVIKRKPLESKAFESDLVLQQTGRFEGQDGQATNQIYPTQESPSIEIQKEFEQPGALESEMRETSYFNSGQMPEAEATLGQLIQIQNQEPQKKQPILIEAVKMQDGGHVFKLSSKSGMKIRANQQSKKFKDNILQTEEDVQQNSSQSPKTNKSKSLQIAMKLDSAPEQNRRHRRPNLLEQETFNKSQNVAASQMHSNGSDEKSSRKSDSPPAHSIGQAELDEIAKVKDQMDKNVNITGNFGKLKLEKQPSTHLNHNYSALKGAQPNQESSETLGLQKQMFTSMSDIGFPSNNPNHKPALQQKKQRDLITADQRQRMMDTQNNWRVRTKTIDELLRDVKDRVESSPEYVLQASEKLLEFFVQLVNDQNFKIVLNTLNILNMILGMPEQKLRQEKLMKNQISAENPFGLSNQQLVMHIPLIVKKLADSKNIIRQEAVKCLFFIFDIMRNGARKDNNFIALILPYLNNSSNWHIREELLHLLMKCFLCSNDPQLFDAFQILDSVIQLFNDSKEKIRNLALETIAAFSSLGLKNKILDIMYRNSADKDIVELIKERLDYGMLPFLNREGLVEIPYQEQLANFDVDSVAHSIANQSSQAPQYYERRKQSIGGGSQASYSKPMTRGGSSGRKVVVTTANAQQLGVSIQDEMLHVIQGKRTTSANNPNFELNDPNFGGEQMNSFSYSMGKGTSSANRESRYPQYDEMMFSIDLNGSSFLPQLQKTPGYEYQAQYRDRMIGSSGNANIGLMQMDPNQKIPNSGGGNKRSTMHLHGTPGHPHNYQAHFSQIDNPQFIRGVSGKVQMPNSSISNKSPSLFDQNTQFLDMSGNLGSHFGGVHQRQNFGPSEIAINDFNESLSAGGRPGLQQTPQQFEQMYLYNLDSSMYNAPIDFSKIGIGKPGFGQVGSPLNADHQSQMMKEGQIGGHAMVKNQQMNNQLYGQPQINKQQKTFYSDGTTFTGITATTGATSSIKGKIMMIKPGGPPKQEIKVNEETKQEAARHILSQGAAGPIKATRAALGAQDQISESEMQDLCIDNRKLKSSSQTQNKLKITTKVQSSAGSQKMTRQASNESEIQEFSLHQRSYSYTKNEKELQSAQLPNRSNFFGKETENSENIEDPALLTQSTKIVYVQSEDLEVLEQPDKEFRKCMQAGQGIFSPDWVSQFESCNIIRQVCRHHHGLILQNGNSLPNLVSQLLKLADSLRSAVSRIALMTLSDMFVQLKRVMEPMLMPTVKILIKKSSDTNQFIADEADKCMSNIVTNCQEGKVLQMLLMQTAVSRSSTQKLKMCVQLLNLVKQLGNNILFFKDNDKLIVQLVKYLQDASAEVRQVAKNAFVAMSQSIMGQNELEKLLQRVLNEVQHKKVREFLDTVQLNNHGSQIDFVITNANNGQANTQTRKSTKQTLKSMRSTGHNGLANKPPAPVDAKEPLNIQAKSILNPSMQKQDSSTYLNKVQLQNPKKQYEGGEPDTDMAQELLSRLATNDWRVRLEVSEAVFELVRSQGNTQCSTDIICKLVNDSNAKISTAALADLVRSLQHVRDKPVIYKSILQNLGSANMSVRKASEQACKQICEAEPNKQGLLAVLVSTASVATNQRQKTAVIEQLLSDVLEQALTSEAAVGSVVPLAYKLLDDPRADVKQRCERLIKKLQSVGIVREALVAQCPAGKLQRVLDIIGKIL